MIERPLAPGRVYFSSIDGLRLIASVNIVLFHMATSGAFCDLGSGLSPLLKVIKGPAFHASIFFILAGFIFTAKYADQAASFNTRVLLIRRLKALYPLHALMTAAMLVLYLWSHWGPNLRYGKAALSGVNHLALTYSLYPTGSLGLNQPSWALSAFFLCYLLFAPALRVVVRFKSIGSISAAMLAVWCLPLLWGWAYIQLPFSESNYFFFHIFAPIRFCEFVLGMFLARLFAVIAKTPGTKPLSGIMRLSDIWLVILVLLLYVNLDLLHSRYPLLRWWSYHAFTLLIYACILFIMAHEKGLISRLFSLKWFRLMGQASFFPYLIHVPLMSWVCWLFQYFLGYKNFLHSWPNIALLLVLLYAGSGWYSSRTRKKRPLTYEHKASV